jgi:hypothetical protein
MLDVYSLCNLVAQSSRAAERAVPACSGASPGVVEHEGAALLPLPCGAFFFNFRPAGDGSSQRGVNARESQIIQTKKRAFLSSTRMELCFRR